ncbi:MAG: hypothetical protein ACP5UA_03005 [Candidatus Hydrogenedens sp.]
MSKIRPIYTFEREGRFFAVDVFDTFCFECDKITYDTLQYYPENTQHKIQNILSTQYTEKELREVWDELEYLRSIGSILKYQKIENWVQSLTQTLHLNTLSFLIDESNFSLIQKIIPLAILKALPYIQANPKFQINLWLHQKYETIQDILNTLNLFIHEQCPNRDKNVVINLYLPMSDYIRAKLKIEDMGKLFLVFPKISAELVQQIETINESVFHNFLNSQNGHILFLPEELPFTPTIEKVFNYDVKKILIDIFSPLALNPDRNIGTFFQELTHLTAVYTQQLKKGNRYILEPIMQLFQNIQHGIPTKRRDPAGIQEWFITSTGDVYGGYLYYKKNLCYMGNIRKDEIPLKDAECLYRLGINTTPACITCWAQNFCGGGHGTIHYRYTGKVTEPRKDWCIAQRKWIEEVIVRYQELNNAGVALFADMPINRDVQKPGKLSILKHIFRSFFKEHISIRPLRPQDEDWLAQWETWNSNIYFTLQWGNILTTTRHEKEQEILNTSREYEEWVIIDKKTKPRGLIKIHMHTIPNLSVVYIYFHNPDDYMNKDIQDNFQILFNQIKSRFPKNRWLIYVNPNDIPLISFIEKLQFQKTGTFRDALFLHNKYNPIDVYIA